MKSAIVTGVSRGLGESLASVLLERGYAVTGVGRASSAALGGDGYRFVPLDLGDAPGIEDALKPAFMAIAQSHPESVCLINNAAAAEPVGVVGTLDDTQVQRSLTVNLFAPLAIANIFCRVFSDASLERRIINVSSGAAQNALPGGGPYSIAKAGLEMLTKQLVAEQISPTFSAITIRPGIIDTGMQVFMREQPRDILPSVDLFRGFHQSGQLLSADVVARKIVEKLVEATVENGRIYAYKEL
jgi:benzil reductase ((S)-benzoin forming)